MKTRMIVTMRGPVAAEFGQASPDRRTKIVGEVKSKLRASAPSVKVVGDVSYATRIIIEEAEVDRLRKGLKDMLVVDRDYGMESL